MKLLLLGLVKAGVGLVCGKLLNLEQGAAAHYECEWVQTHRVS